MKYKATLKKGFKEAICYVLFPDKSKQSLIYEVGMTGYEIANKDYHLVRQGYYTYLLSLTISGKAKMVYNGKTYNIEKGDLVFINCNEPHEFLPCGKESWEFLYIHVTGLGLVHLYDEFVNKTGYVYKNYPAKEFIKLINGIHKKLEALPAEKVDYSLHIHDWNSVSIDLSESVYMILCNVIRNLQKIKTDIPYSLRVALEHIKQNFNHKLTLNEIAEHACLSKFHFEREFTKYMGMTVYKYISELRFERARWLIESTNKKTLEIALEVGFSDVQGLNKLFLDNTGKTPSQYRKEKTHY